MINYPIVIFWNEASQRYIADVPDLECCSAYGETPEEALKEVLVALSLWLEAAHANGYLIPEPTRDPALRRASA